MLLPLQRPSLAAAFVSRRFSVVGSSKRIPWWQHSFALSSSPTESAELVAQTRNEKDSKELASVPKRFVDFPFQYHQVLTNVTVESLSNLGMGIARVDLSEYGVTDDERLRVAEKEAEATDANNDHDDDVSTFSLSSKAWVVMIPNVIPGEVVSCQVYRNFPTYSEADLMEVQQASPDRVAPRCPVASVCGGCQYQHVSVEAQRRWKTRQVYEVMHRIGRLSPQLLESGVLRDTLGTSQVYHYRSKITPHYEAPQRQGRRGKDDDAPLELEAIGFQQKSSRRLVDVNYCAIATEPINEELQRRRRDLFQKARDGLLHKRKGATLLLRHAVSVNGTDIVTTKPQEFVTTTVGPCQFRFRAGNFFQTNPFMLNTMVQVVLDALQLDSNIQHVLDCYCGSGLFGVSIAAQKSRREEGPLSVVGIEVNAQAIEEASYNAYTLNQLSPDDISFVAASAEAIFEDPFVQALDGSKTAVVMDPPRKGCSREFLQQLLRYQPQLILYMSCNAATQARDLEILLSQQGNYQVCDIQPLDLFPQTRHVECFVVLQRMLV